MKKLLFILSIFAALSAKANTADTLKVDTVKNAIQVKPVVFNQMNKDTLYQFTVKVFGVQLKDTTSGANTYIEFYDRTAKRIGDKNVPLPASVVNAWGTDDTSVITFILNSLGLQKR